MVKHLRSIWILLRFPNLLITAATQYAMRYLIVEPLLPSEDFGLQMSDFHFFLLVLATMFIAAGGYIINDYFDTRTDMINKPARVVVGVEISRRIAMFMHSAFNILGVGIGIYLAFYIKLPALALVFVLASGLLWFYSTTYKRQFLLGNLIVAFLAGLVPLMVILFELPLLNLEYGKEMLQNELNFNYIFFWVCAFSFFAFMTNLVRELIKDAEDFEGDAAYGMKTLPIVLGDRWTRGIITALIALVLAALLFLLFRYILHSVTPPDYLSLGYFVLFLLLPLLVLALQVLRARDKKAYHRASTLIKIIMLNGILYSVVVFYLLAFKY